MKRILNYKIEKRDEGKKISHFLRSKGYSAQNLVDLKKMDKSVILNGKWCYMNARLKEGDKLLIHINETKVSEKIPPIYIPIDIVYEDDDILVIDKKSGMPIHPSRNNYENSMANALAFYFKSQGKPFVFRCTNRLDKDTSGLTVVAKHMLSASVLGKQTKNRSFKREYLAICKGSIEPKSGVIDAPLSRKAGSIIERTVDFEKGERAVTHYEKVLENKGYSLVRLKLETGRTHQIRIHMKYLGFPLIGDYLYNPDMEMIKRQALHSEKISFTHPITGENMTFVSQLPDDMAWILKKSEKT